MKRLAEQEHWNKTFYTKKPSVFTRVLPKSFAAAHFERIIKPCAEKGKTILEIGAAPGTTLLSIAKKFQLEPYGFDYNELGVKQTRENFVLADQNPNHVFHADLFDAKFRKKHSHEFDIVYSAGFIEHFTNPKQAIQYHFDLVKSGGVVIITLPNLKGIRAIVPEDMLEKHNLSIMTPGAVVRELPNKARVIERGYYGGILNLGLVYYSNKFLEALRLVCYVFQRIILDQLQRLLLILRIKLQNKHTTPYVYVIARNNG